LKAEPCLQFDDTAGQCALSLAELPVAGRAVEADRVVDVGEVQLVEDVVEIGANVQLRILSQNRHLGQSEGLGQGEIDVEIVGSPKNVASDPRRLRDGA